MGKPGVAPAPERNGDSKQPLRCPPYHHYNELRHGCVSNSCIEDGFHITFEYKKYCEKDYYFDLQKLKDAMVETAAAVLSAYQFMMTFLWLKQKEERDYYWSRGFEHYGTGPSPQSYFGRYRPDHYSYVVGHLGELLENVFLGIPAGPWGKRKPVRFKCWETRQCSLTEDTVATYIGGNPPRMRLCPRFWMLSVGNMRTTLIHEFMHSVGLQHQRHSGCAGTDYMGAHACTADITDVGFLAEKYPFYAIMNPDNYQAWISCHFHEHGMCAVT